MSSDWSRLARQLPLLRVLIFLTIIIVVWLPLALPLYWASDQDRLPGGDLIPTALLYLVFLVGLPLWQQRVHQIPHTWKVLGFTGGRRLAQGLIMGIGLGCPQSPVSPHLIPSHHRLRRSPNSPSGRLV
jgi:hypothetical protein